MTTTYHSHLNMNKFEVMLYNTFWIILVPYSSVYFISGIFNRYELFICCNFSDLSFFSIYLIASILSEIKESIFKLSWFYPGLNSFLSSNLSLCYFHPLTFLFIAMLRRSHCSCNFVSCSFIYWHAVLISYVTLKLYGSVSMTVILFLKVKKAKKQRDVYDGAQLPALFPQTILHNRASFFSNMNNNLCYSIAYNSETLMQMRHYPNYSAGLRGLEQV